MILSNDLHAQLPNSSSNADQINRRINVDTIIISGNIITRNYIILREIPFKQKDSINYYNLKEQLKLCRQHIYNTTLFVDVKVDEQMTSETNCTISIIVKERWYIFPIPQFQLVARSFNEWVHKYHSSLNRVNYGVNFTDNNFTGRRDKLKLSLINGFSQNLSLVYTLPYIDKKLVSGLVLGMGYQRARELPYATNYQNQQLFYKRNDFITHNWNFSIGYSIRKAIVKRQLIRLRMNVITVPDSILTTYNTGYFNSNKNTTIVPELSYLSYYENVDNILYPLKGKLARLFFSKRGFGISGGINMFSVFGEFDRYYSLGRKWFASIAALAQVKLPLEQPYINQRALGFEENYIRGLELYVIDGSAFTFSRMNLKRELIHFTVPGFKKPGTYHRIPFTIYGKAFTDVGYVYATPSNSSMLNNRLLYSTGIGLDIVTLYDFHLRLEYSFNQLGENGLFLHNGSGL